MLTLPLMFIIQRSVHFFQPTFNDINYSSTEALRYLLRKIRHTDILLTGNGAAMRQDLPTDQLQQSGFTHAVASQQSHPFATFDLQVNFIQQARSTKTN